MSLEVKNISFAYDAKPVLKNVSFSVDYGQFISVLGPNGTGKSTLFQCMLGLLSPQQGEILLDGQNIARMNDEQMAANIAYIPQSHNPVFNYTVTDMVLMGTTAHLGKFSSPGRSQVKLVLSILEQLGIGALKDRGYRSISGGERQLVLIARAMAQQAKILIMDEPSSSLDFGNRIRVMRTMKALSQQGYAIIQSTHDPDQAYLYSDRILALHQGEVLAFGVPESLVSNGLISKLYGVEVEVFSLQGGQIRICLPADLRHSQYERKDHS